MIKIEGSIEDIDKIYEHDYIIMIIFCEYDNQENERSGSF